MSSVWDSKSIQTLMGSNNGLAGLVGDYNSIKSGSYGKLLKSYYSGMTSESKGSSGSSKNITEKLIEERRNPTVSAEVSTANAKLSSSVSNMTGALSSLQDGATYEDTEGGSTGQTKASSALKSYVSAYNDAVESSKKSSMTNVSKNIAGAMSGVMQKVESTKQSTPPPIPQEQYHVAINGKAEGPYTIDQISILIKEGKVDVNTLVWKKGMADWIKAGDDSVVANLLEQVAEQTPPPLPNL